MHCKPANLSFFMSLLMGGIISIGSAAFGQSGYDSYTVSPWNPATENWDLDTVMIFQGPSSGNFYRDSTGNWIYQSTNDSEDYDSMTVGMFADELMAYITVDIDKLSGTVVKSYESSGRHATVTDNGSANGNGGGVVISGPGTVPPVDTGGTIHVFTTDDTVPDDGDDIEEDLDDGWWGGTVTVHEGIDSWGDLITPLGNEENGTVDVIVISGHGWGGGVSTSTGGLDVETLGDAAEVIIETRTSPTGVLVLGGCSTASPGIDDNGNGTHDLQDLADELGIPVIGNTGTVSDGLNGAGDWVRFDPQPAGN